MKTILLLFILFSATNIFAHNGKWTRMHPENHPSARELFGMAQLTDGKILLFGGNNITQHELNNDTWIFDLATKQWTIINTIHKPAERFRHGMANITDGKVLLFGGQVLSGNTHVEVNDTWIFDIETMDWEELIPVDSAYPRERFNISKLTDNRVLIFGGNVDLPGDDFWVHASDTWYFDLQKNRWKRVGYPSGFFIDGREAGQMAYLDNGRVLMTGGWHYKYLDDNYIFDYLDIDILDYSLDTINPKSNIPKVVGSSMANLCEGSILLYGGNTGTWQFIDTWIFSIKDTSWKELKLTSPPERSAHTISKISDNKVILFGGNGYDYEGEYNFNYSDTWLFEYEPNDVEENENSKTAGIIQNGDRAKISIPSDNSIHNPKLKIVDICGREIFIDYSFSNSADSSRIEFSTTNLAAGVYFATVKAGAEVWNFKFFAE